MRGAIFVQLSCRTRYVAIGDWKFVVPFLARKKVLRFEDPDWLNSKSHQVFVQSFSFAQVREPTRNNIRQEIYPPTTRWKFFDFRASFHVIWKKKPTITNTITIYRCVHWHSPAIGDATYLAVHSFGADGLTCQIDGNIGPIHRFGERA